MSAEILRNGVEVVTTWEIVVELVALLRYRLGFVGSRIFLAEVMPTLTIVHPDAREREAAIAFYLQRSQKRRLSLCDAISYVIVSTRLEWAPCLTFDGDFAALGLRVVS